MVYEKRKRQLRREALRTFSLPPLSFVVRGAVSCSAILEDRWCDMPNRGMERIVRVIRPLEFEQALIVGSEG